MKATNDDAHTILAIEAVEETRDGLEVLLKRDGYRVESARDREDATRRARVNTPDLILISHGAPMAEVVTLARHIKDDADLRKDLPVVIFCVEEIDQGAAVIIDSNINLTRPDNFNQVRELIGQLLHAQPNAL